LHRGREATRLLDGMSTRFYAKERSLRGGNAEKQPRLGLAIRRLSAGGEDLSWPQQIAERPSKNRTKPPLF
jgi:hypothetical protein